MVGDSGFTMTKHDPTHKSGGLIPGAEDSATIVITSDLLLGESRLDHIQALNVGLSDLAILYHASASIHAEQDETRAARSLS